MTRPPRPPRARAASRRLSRLALVALSAAGALFGAELVVRRVHPVRTLLFRLDPELLHTTVPGARRVLVMPAVAGGEHVLTEIGAQGLRGDVPRKTRTTRVAVYGDSLVLAENVAFEDTFVERLGVHLSREVGREIETLNAGVTGYGPDQALLKLERDLERLSPDFVLVVLCANNDFGDLVRNKLFDLGAGGELRPAPHELSPRLVELFAAYEAEAARPALVRAVRELRESRARDANTARGGPPPPYIAEYLAACRAEYEERVLHLDPRVWTLFRDYYDADLALRPESESAVFKRALMAAVLRRLRETCASRDVPLAALVVPSAVDLCRDFEIRVDPERWPGYSPTRLTDALAALLAELEVPALDLYGPFEQAGADGLFVGHDDIHWNASGQDLGARLAAAFVGALLPAPE